MLVLRRIYLRRVVRSVEPEECDVNNPDTVEVDEQMEPRTRLLVSLEEALLPVDVLELEVSLGRRHINQLALILHDDAVNSLGVPEKLVDVIVTDNLIMFLFLSYKLAIHHLITLIPHEPIQRFDHALKVETFGNGIYAVLTL